MRPCIVLALVLDWAAAYASASSLDNNARSFLGDALVRKDPLQTVLDHTPASVLPTCEPSVRALRRYPARILTEACAADRTYRNDYVRLRDYGECKSRAV